MDSKTTLINEFRYEAFLTPRLLAIVPLGKANWRPHLKSMTVIELARHIARIPGRVTRIITTQDWDGQDERQKWTGQGHEDVEDNAMAQGDYLPDDRKILDVFDIAVLQAMKDIRSADQENTEHNWTKREGEHMLFALPRITAIRFLTQNHMANHKGQLRVYSRLPYMDLPGIYGYSGHSSSSP